MTIRINLLSMSVCSLILGWWTIASAQRNPETIDSLPITTQWLVDAAGPSNRAAITSVFKIICPQGNSLGTGFALDTGYVITNEHVVKGCAAGDLILLPSSGGTAVASSLVVDINRDLAAMKVVIGSTPGLKIEKSATLKIGIPFSVWGYPFGHDGPAPLWTLGYLSGFNLYQPEPPAQGVVKHLVVMGAFNPGNSGGPLLLPSGAVVGVVVSKRQFPLPPFLETALQVLAKNEVGTGFEGTDGKGKRKVFMESQLVAELLNYYRKVSQVHIGEAIAIEELIAFLDANKVPWNSMAPVRIKKNK